MRRAAANRRRGREFLRMFRDAGRYPTLFPKADDVPGAARLLAKHPDLERVSPNGPVKRSLFNVFKMLRPVAAPDEPHKAHGEKRAAGEEFARPPAGVRRGGVPRGAGRRAGGVAAPRAATRR